MSVYDREAVHQVGGGLPECAAAATLSSGVR